MSVADHLGRSHDLSILHGVAATGRTLLQVNLSGNEVCTGVQKLAQAVLINLFIEKESDPFRPTRGTDFLTNLRAGRIRTNNDVQVEFGAAAAELLDQFDEAVTDDTPDDEVLTALDLLSFSISDAKLVLSAKITTRAGGSRSVLLPTPIPMV